MAEFGAFWFLLSALYIWEVLALPVYLLVYTGLWSHRREPCLLALAGQHE